jgi:hypothetical protein
LAGPIERPDGGFKGFLKLDKESFREDTESKSKGIVEQGLQNG